MVIKLYISGISGNKEVKKKQQRVQMILDSKQINYEAIDITEPGKEKDKEFMQQNGKVRESLGKYPLPPQIFNDDDFCGDYEDFDMANEVDELEKFLHIETSSSESDAKQDESNSLNEKFSCYKESLSQSDFNPYEYHTFKIKFNGVNGLKEPIINTNDLAGENEQTEEVKKSEVNGESEVSPSLEPSENVTENVDISNEEVVAPEKEESSVQETKTNDERSEKRDEENAEDNKEEEKGAEDNVEEEKNAEDNKEEEEEKEEEAAEKEEEDEKDVEEVEKKEEEVESSKVENSPPPEEKETDDNDEEKEEVESEKEENESDEESPQSEKSQE